MGDDAALGQRVVVGALEEFLVRMRVADEVRAVFGERGAEVRALVSGEPEIACRDGRIRTADHFKFKIGDDVVERDRRVLDEVAVAEASDFFRTEEREDDGALWALALAERAGEFYDRGGAGGVIVGSVINRVAVDAGADAEVVEVRREQNCILLRL